jgi:DNA-binding CsgD family transcriptional regulator
MISLVNDLLLGFGNAEVRENDCLLGLSSAEVHRLESMLERVLDNAGARQAPVRKEAAGALPSLDLALLDLRLRDIVGCDRVSAPPARHPIVPMIVGALRLVLAGGIRIPGPAIADMASRDAAATSRGDGRPSPRSLGLTPRQAEVLRLMLAGKSNKVIGRELGLAEGTVKNHVAAVLRALQVTTRTQAVIAASKRELKD